MDRQLPDIIDGYMDYTENSEPPDSYRKWVAIGMVAAALQRKCYLEFGMLTFHTNFYILLVGKSAIRKGTAMGPAYDLLTDLGVKISADSTTREALIRRLKEANANEILPDNSLYFHSSMTIFSPEFSVFIKRKSEDLISDLCDLYDCRNRWTYDTKGQGTDEIIGVWLNILGATTPDDIQENFPLTAIGKGLASRFIFVYEEQKGKICPYTYLTKDQQRIKEGVINDLAVINSMRGKFKYTKEFMEEWVEWYTKTETSPPVIRDPRFDGYVGRRPHHIMKLSLIMNAARTSSMVLEPRDLHKAIHTLESIEGNMPKTFTGVGKSQISDLVPKIMREISLGGKVPLSYLMGKFYNDADKVVMTRALETLESMGFLRIVHVPGQGVFLVHNPECRLDDSGGPVGIGGK